MAYPQVALCKLTFIAGVLVLSLSALATEPPRLVLQITVDALRGDLPQRHLSKMGKGGFRYLIDHGVSYTNAHYEHGNTETVVGHSSLATGTIPAIHGMVGNLWFDRHANHLVYNVEDSRYHLLNKDADVDRSSEIDPTQRAATVDGRSPRAILSSTFSDELAAVYGKDSKVFAVSVKDRGAIPLAGQMGKAFWFSKAAGEFVTSNYYYDTYPQWVLDWNQSKPAAQYGGKAWQLMHPIDDYQYGDADDQAWETDFPGYGRIFPHAFGSAEDKYFTTRLTLSPAGDQLTLGFAKALMQAEGLGQDETPDYLSISFSSNDYVLHLFGLSSLEAEDNLLQLDRTLAELLAYVDKTVGLEHTLIVLSADHGSPTTPPYLASLGNRNVHYFDVDACMQAIGSAPLPGQSVALETLIRTYSHPYVYLDYDAIEQSELTLAAVASQVAERLMGCPGVNAAITAGASVGSQAQDDLVARRVSNNYHGARSGDIYLVLQSGAYVNDFDGLVVASTHGSPWNYDTHVPILFSGQGIKRNTVSLPVSPYDIAPTLSARLGIESPSGASGHPLREVTED